MKKSIAYAVFNGLVLATLSQGVMAGQVLDYAIRWSAEDNRYHVYMKPSETPSPDRSMTAQVTILVPHSDTDGFQVSELSSSIDGIAWVMESPSKAPEENTNVDYLSFSMTPSNMAAFAWQADQEIEAFSFANSGACLGEVTLINNTTDPFIIPINDGGSNSLHHNVGNHFANLGWSDYTNENNYRANYGGPADCRTAGSNHAPVANNDSASVIEGGSVSINVLINDTDDDNDQLTITSKTDGSHGAVLVNSSSVTYTPDAGFTGSDSFTYTITDGKGGDATATVSVTVTAQQSTNHAPVANNDSASVTEGGSVGINVLINDIDGDNDQLTITSKTDGSHGTVLVNGSSITYTPDAGFTGSDSFTYTITDGKGGDATATVSVTVTAQQSTNHAPVANDDTATVVSGDPVEIDVLVNDSDDDGDTLSILSVGNAANGSTRVQNGKIIYTSNNTGFSGSDSFNYTVSDGIDEGSATITVTVTSPADNDGDGISNDDEDALGTDPDKGDSDGDGISDAVEIGGNISGPLDTDNDGVIDALDDDDDNDGILSVFENYNGGSLRDDDTDGDGKPDYLDPDDDNDGLMTAQEAPDSNGDGNPDDAADIDQNGIPDYLQRPGNAAPTTQKAIPTLTQWAQILLSMLLGIVALRTYLGKNKRVI